LAVHAVDVSAVALAAASESRESGPSFYQAALERLPFAAASFDYLCSHEVIEHVEDPAVVLAEFLRVLKPGGVCAIATPNGASWWIEHLRQRCMRLLGRRGAPIGEDHTRSPRFWRREFERAGFIVERRILDGAALEFLLFVAPARWMPRLTRLLEPLRVVPGINLVLCDRVKFRLRKPGKTLGTTGAVALCCPLCRSPATDQGYSVMCESGHRFGRNAGGLVDFITPLSERPAETEPPSGGTAAGDPHVGENSGDLARGKQSPRVRRLRRLVLHCFGIIYAGSLMLMAPVGAVAGLFHQPFHQAPRRLKTEV